MNLNEGPRSSLALQRGLYLLDQLIDGRTLLWVNLQAAVNQVLQRFRVRRVAGIFVLRVHHGHSNGTALLRRLTGLEWRMRVS